MKNLLIILCFAFGVSTSAFSNNNVPSPLEEELSHIDANVSFSMKSNSALILGTKYNEDTQDITIATKSTINLLQVLNEEGEIEYQIPIGSDVLNLFLPDFETGNYTINLLLEGETKFVSTDLSKKK